MTKRKFPTRVTEAEEIERRRSHQFQDLKGPQFQWEFPPWPLKKHQVCRPKSTQVKSSKSKIHRNLATNPPQRPRIKRYGLDYLEIFAPVLRYNTLRLVLFLVALHSWKIRQMDVKTAFLNGNLDEDTEIYMAQPSNFVVPGMEDQVCKLQKAIYGLKQAPRCWYLTLHQYLVEIGFQRCVKEVCLYVKRVGDFMVLLTVYACDALKKRFEMTDLGELKSILGIQVEVKDKVVTMSQQGYVEVLLEKFNMVDSKPVSTPENSDLIELANLTCIFNKFDAVGRLTKYKVRLVIKGFLQRYGLDYLEIFAPVLRYNTLRLVLFLVALHSWKIRQMDVKTAFLNGNLDEDNLLANEVIAIVDVLGAAMMLWVLGQSNASLIVFPNRNRYAIFEFAELLQKCFHPQCLLRGFRETH
ncbi:hypothetical protein AaE_001839, partial [Aphanomyces astaci]